MLFFWVPALHAQATDPNGLITSNNWLALGPFRNTFGCGTQESILGNHIAPSYIGCQFPVDGDEVDYDDGLAVTTAYIGPVGPTGSPVWRPFNDQSDDGDQNMDTDAGADLSDVMTWLATYVEYKGDDPVRVELCIGSDDGVQVWFDELLVHNNNACRGRGMCQDNVDIFMKAGLHRFAIAAWERGGGWGCSLGMKVDGQPVVDDGSYPDFVFHGIEGGDKLKDQHLDCEPQDPVVPGQRVNTMVCSKNGDGSVTLTWENPANVDPVLPIDVYVNGRKIESVSGDSTKYTIKASDVPAEAPVGYCVVNGSGLPRCCETARTDGAGFIKTSSWLVLGPFSNPFGCNNNNESILGNHIAPSTMGCQYPVAGDEVEYDPKLSVSTGYTGPESPDGLPYWRLFDDGSDNADQDMDLDVGDRNDSVSFLATYLENKSGGPLDVNLCVGSDDGVQVWFNNVVVHNNNACRARGTCQDNVVAVLPPGIVRIVIAAWERGGGWGCSLALQESDGITPIADDGTHPDIIFHGINRPGAGDFCRIFATRDIPGELVNGTSGSVTFKIDPRAGEPVVKVHEVVPPGLSAASPSHGGVIKGNVIDWDLGKVKEVLTLTYTLTAAKDAKDGFFDSEVTADGAEVFIQGDTSYTGSPQTDLGFIKLWNHLGPLAFNFPAKAADHGDPAPGACNANQGVDLTLDWIANEGGSVTEANVRPFPGLVTRPKYGGTGLPGGGARAAGLVILPGDTGKVVRDQFPVWKGSAGPNDTVVHASSFVSGFDAEDHLTMSLVYLTNNTGADISTQVGFSSDDSIQIFVNEVDVTGGGVVACRGFDDPNVEQDTRPAILKPGENRILVKVTDGCCPSGFRLRFHKDPADPNKGGLTDPEITLSLESAANPGLGTMTRRLVKKTFALGEAIPVSLELNMKQASNVSVREVLPAGAVANSISERGAQVGDAIEWNLTGVTAKALSYQVVPSNCVGETTFGQSTFKVGPNEVAGGGDSALSRLYQDDLLGGWVSKDIATTGSTVQRLGDHAVFVSGTGAGVKLTSDRFRFVYHEAAGDSEIVTRIDCMDDEDTRGTAGVMLRASDDAKAANIYLYLNLQATGNNAGTLKAGIRSDTGKPTSQVALTDKDVASLPVWLKIVRGGAKVSLQRSTDGVAFTELATRNIGVGSEINLPANYLSGLAVSAGGGESARASFSQISGPPILPPVVIGKKFRRGDADGNGLVELTDAVRLLGFLFLGGAKPECHDAADVDDSGAADISDAIANLNYQFVGGAAPLPPGPSTCGVDPNEEEPDLGCDVSCP